jgi:hypothetical protein
LWELFFWDNHMTKNQLLLIGFTSFTAMVVIGMRMTKKKWDKLHSHFPTDLKLSLSETKPTAIKIDNDIFKKVRIAVLPQGLFISQNGLLPVFFIPGRILIPWNAFGIFYSTEKKVLLYSITHHFSDIRTIEGKVTLMLNEDIMKEIISIKSE